MEDDDYDEDLMIIFTSMEDIEDDLDTKNEEWARSRLNWHRHVSKLQYEGLFNKKYRMSIEAFNNLVDILTPYIKQQPWNRKTFQEPVTPNIMVSATIRLLAGGSYLDIYETHGMTYSYLYRVRNKVLKAILECEDLKIEYPSNDEDINHVRVGFTQGSNQNLLHKCLGVLDGMLQPIHCPSISDCNGNQDGYFSGHYQTYGLNCQGMCDSWLRFTFFSIAAPGKVPDQVALERTYFHQILDAIPNFHYILGDAAYTLTNKVLTPFTGSQRNVPEHDSFNFHLSQLRIRIEMAFGRLVGKWRILRAPLQQGSLKRNIQIIMACARLHNYVINQDVDLAIDPFSLTSDYHDISPLQTEGGLLSHLGYFPTVEPFNNVAGTSEMRSVIVDYIKEKNISRPQSNIDRNT